MTHSHFAVAIGYLTEIGPEIIIKACEKLRSRIKASALRLLIISSGATLKNVAVQLEAKLGPEVRAPDKVWPNQCFLETDTDGEPIKLGLLSADGGRFAFEAVEQHILMTQAGRIGGIVTTLQNKQPLHNAGHKYTGHSEMLAEFTGVEELRDDPSSLSSAVPFEEFPVTSSQ